MDRAAGLSVPAVLFPAVFPAAVFGRAVSPPPPAPPPCPQISAGSQPKAVLID